MSRPITRKLPTGRGSFSYGRVPEPGRGMVIYRLFRRDQNGRVHCWQQAFTMLETREAMSHMLRQARHVLRNTVDEIDLEIMGVTQ